MHSVGHGWSSSSGVATVERKPYRGPGRHYSVPETGKTVIVKRPDPPMVRVPDHDTSHEGAATAELTKESVQRKLLAAWYGAGEKGFTDEEAAESAELTDACYWKRAGELRAKGHLEFTGEKRKGRKGVNRKVSRFVAEM